MPVTRSNPLFRFNRLLEDTFNSKCLPALRTLNTNYSNIEKKLNDKEYKHRNEFMADLDKVIKDAKESLIPIGEIPARLKNGFKHFDSEKTLNELPNACIKQFEAINDELSKFESDETHRSSTDAQKNKSIELSPKNLEKGPIQVANFLVHSLGTGELDYFYPVGYKIQTKIQGGRDVTFYITEGPKFHILDHETETEFAGTSLLKVTQNFSGAFKMSLVYGHAADYFGFNEPVIKNLNRLADQPNHGLQTKEEQPEVQAPTTPIKRKRRSLAPREIKNDESDEEPVAKINKADTPGATPRRSSRTKKLESHEDEQHDEEDKTSTPKKTKKDSIKEPEDEKQIENDLIIKPTTRSSKRKIESVVEAEKKPTKRKKTSQQTEKQEVESQCTEPVVDSPPKTPVKKSKRTKKESKDVSKKEEESVDKEEEITKDEEQPVKWTRKAEPKKKQTKKVTKKKNHGDDEEVQEQPKTPTTRKRKQKNDSDDSDDESFVPKSGHETRDTPTPSKVPTTPATPIRPILKATEKNETDKTNRGVTFSPDVHDLEKLIPCPICQRTFSKYQMRPHMNKKHFSVTNIDEEVNKKNEENRKLKNKLIEDIKKTVIEFDLEKRRMIQQHMLSLEE
ncbi:hypothetical protein AKO1_005618 [Acrasis kona]|uniref:C2H2-type domain-containing protein n=1 Tax=Acrasis kona TaxID=1008807 RepID=A0AAW2YIZ1_9EUKA